jgi:hypothetical protein
MLLVMAKHRKPPRGQLRKIPLTNFSERPEEQEAAPTCPVDPGHPPMTLKPSGTWLCQQCGAERLGVVSDTYVSP